LLLCQFDWQEKVMRLKKLNQQLTLLANFGVMISIIFLAIEVNQNTATLRAQD
jgi:hypothetical protein